MLTDEMMTEMDDAIQADLYRAARDLVEMEWEPSEADIVFYLHAVECDFDGPYCACGGDFRMVANVGP